MQLSQVEPTLTFLSLPLFPRLFFFPLLLPTPAKPHVHMKLSCSCDPEGYSHLSNLAALVLLTFVIEVCKMAFTLGTGYCVSSQLCYQNPVGYKYYCPFYMDENKSPNKEQWCILLEITQLQSD
jgi:hypothetical protein